MEFSRAETRRRYLNGIIPLVIGVGAVVYAPMLSLGSLAKPGPGLWPFAVGIVVVLTASYLVFSEHRAPERDSASFAGIRPVVYGILALCIYIILFSWLGFIIPSAFLLVYWIKVLGEESWSMALGVAVPVPFGLYILFDVLLGVPFPEDLVTASLGL